MKNSLILLAAIASLLFSSCEKSGTGSGSGTGYNTDKIIRFEFNANVAAAYTIHAGTSYVSFDETINAAAWNKTINAGNAQYTVPDTAHLAVFPPEAWMNTSNQANGTIRIFVNNVEKASKNLVLIGIDRPSGYHIKTAY